MEDYTAAISGFIATLLVFAISILRAGRKIKPERKVDPRLKWPPDMQIELTPYEKELVRKAEREAMVQMMKTSPRYIPGVGITPLFTEEKGFKKAPYFLCTQCAGSLTDGQCDYCKTKQR